MTGRALYFTGPGSVSVREETVPAPGPGEVRVRTTRSGISPGTELLVYNDDVPDDLQADETIDAISGTFSYPLKYGYAAVGRVEAIGEDVDEAWQDRQVFGFVPHQSHFLASPSDLIPTTLPPDRALFVPNVEAAVNFVMDARPRIGSRVTVFGQGPVGLLTTAVLSSFPLGELVTVDCHERRRSLSETLGADRSVRPGEVEAVLDAEPDIAFELSGNPDALSEAIATTGYAGQVIVGSWYGIKDVTLDLGRAYHRSHIRVRSSQVSRVDPDHADRWDKDRRLSVVLSWLADNDPTPMLTHTVDLSEAGEAYRLLDERPDEAVQVAFTYD